MINGKESIFGHESDVLYMRKALDQARQAAMKGEVPIGAIVVDAHGIIIARGHNNVERAHTQQAHAEHIAIVKAGKKIGDWRLEGCWLFVTLEPCTMCMGLIRLSRIAGIVYGAVSPLFGHCLDNEGISRVYKKDMPKIVAGVGEQESSILLKQFFQQKRKKG